MRLRVDGIEPDDRPIRVDFAGIPIVAQEGDTVAAALIHAGQMGYRTAAEGDLRGVFCGMGVCHECAVVIDGVPSRLACMTPASDAMAVGRQPVRPDPPAGVVSSKPERVVDTDLLIVGGGPAGLSVARVAGRAGLRVIVVDERSKLGGQYFKQPAHGRIDEGRLDEQYTEGRALIREATESGATVMLGVRIWGTDGPTTILAEGPEERYVIRSPRLVLAAGAYERGVPLPGWTLPGVMTTGAAQTLLRANQVAPGSRVLISGNGPLNLQLAADLTAAGVTVVALAEVADVRWWAGLAPGMGMVSASPKIVMRGLRYRSRLVRKRVPVIARSALVAADGDDAVRSATVARLDADGYPIPGTERHFEVDAICVGFGFLPSNELSRLLGCAHRFDERSGTLVVDRTASGRTSVDGVWVVGDAGGVAGAQVAMAAGVLAACDVVSDLGKPVPADVERERSRAERLVRAHTRFQRHLWRLYDAPVLTDQLAAPDTVVCRCESVTLGELSAGLDAGIGSAGALKRLTRAGMGKCQGRYCGPVVTRMAARASGAPIDEFAGFAPQAPFKPTEIAAIAAPEPPA